MRGRLKELREARHLTQTGVGSQVGASQQNISKYEQDICSMPVDMVICIADLFNVSTDYLLGRSEVKRNLEEQIRVTKQIEEYNEVIERYKSLDERDKEIIWATLDVMVKSKHKEN